MNTIAPSMHDDRPTVVAFGGGKGGAGRSTMCAEIARSLARQGQRILCVDASFGCPTLNVFLSAKEPRFDVLGGEAPPVGEPSSHLADYITATNHKHIWLASLAAGRRFPFVRPRFHAEDFIDQMHQLDFDWVLVDLPPAIDPFCVGLFTQSDIPILVCTPEPASVRMTTQFLRSSLFQTIGSHPDGARFEDRLMQLIYDQPLHLNQKTLRAAAQGDPGLEAILDETLLAFEVYLIVNLVREGAERDLGFVLSHAWYMELGIFPRFLTPIDYEDRRWFYNRRTAGTTSSRGDEALSNDVEQLVRHLNQIEQVDQRYPRPVPDDEDAPTALILGLSEDTNPNLVRQHCRRLWEGYRREATVALAFSDPTERTKMAERIEILYKRSLSLPGEHRVPDPSSLSVPREAHEGEEEEATAAAKEESADEPRKTRFRRPKLPTPAELLSSAKGGDPSKTKESAPHDLPGGPAMPEQSPGRLIERLRREKGISLQDLSQRTHIGLKYLAAIEDADLDILPRQVYLRGYLREIARIFDADPDHLVAEYFRLLDALQEREASQ